MHVACLRRRLLLLPGVACSLPRAATDEGSQGWLGVYHTAHGPTVSPAGADAWSVGHWGVVAIENAPADGSFPLRQDVAYNCRGVGASGVNALYGMLVGPSEGGAVSNANDTDLWEPLPLLRRVSGRMAPGSAGPRGPAGVLQGAAR